MYKIKSISNRSIKLVNQTILFCVAVVYHIYIDIVSKYYVLYTSMRFDGNVIIINRTY